MERKERLTKGLCGWLWSRIFSRGKGEVSFEQLCLGSLQSSDIGKVLSSVSPEKEALTLVNGLRDSKRQHSPPWPRAGCCVLTSLQLRYSSAVNLTRDSREGFLSLSNLMVLAPALASMLFPCCAGQAVEEGTALCPAGQAERGQGGREPQKGTVRSRRRMGRRECKNVGRWDGRSEGHSTGRRLWRNLEATEGRWRMGQAKSRLPAFHPSQCSCPIPRSSSVPPPWRRSFQKTSAITSAAAAGSEQESFP